MLAQRTAKGDTGKPTLVKDDLVSKDTDVKLSVLNEPVQDISAGLAPRLDV
jgi:hypothetical protein